MSDELSARARAILEAAERAAGQLTPGVEEAGASGPGAAQAAGAAGPEAAVEPAPPSLPATAPGQLLAIIDQIVQAAEGARRRIDELSRTLDELTRRVDAAGRAVDGTPAPIAAADLAAARLLAIELAVSGSTRMEVDRRLRDELGLRETRALLDEIFGADSAPGARLPWGGT